MGVVKTCKSKGLKIVLTQFFLLAGLSSFSQQNTINEFLQAMTPRVVCDGSGWMSVAEINKNQIKPVFNCIRYPNNLITKQQSPTKIIKDLFIMNLGFFCKNELALDKITPIAIRFRLGSLDHVNWMEQKPNAIKPFR